MQLLKVLCVLGLLATPDLVLAGPQEGPFRVIPPPAAHMGNQEIAACEKILKCWAAGDQAKAEAMAVERLKRFPAERRTNFIRAVFRRSRFDKVAPARVFRSLVKANPNDAIGRSSQMVLTLDQHIDVDTQLNALSRLADENPSDVLIIWLLGIECREHDANELGVKAYARLCTMVSPGGSLVHQTYANLLDELDRHEEALEHRKLAVRLEPASWSYDGMGDTLFNLKRYEEAEPAYAKVVELDPTYAGYWQQLACNENALGRYELARDHASQAVEIDPNNYWGWLTLAIAHEKLNEPDEALAAYQVAARMCPNAQEPRAGIARLSEQKK